MKMWMSLLAERKRCGESFYNRGRKTGLRLYGWRSETHSFVSIKVMSPTLMYEDEVSSYPEARAKSVDQCHMRAGCQAAAEVKRQIQVLHNLHSVEWLPVGLLQVSHLSQLSFVVFQSLQNHLYMTFITFTRTAGGTLETLRPVYTESDWSSWELLCLHRLTRPLTTAYSQPVAHH